MTITVITQTTAERRQETIDKYNECKPYLDKGMSLTGALRELGYAHSNQAWIRDLFKYAESKGYVKK